MSAKEIPGFYFDQERNKYFRIQPDHRAPEGSAHSKSAVKAKIESTELEKIKQDRESRERNGQVQRHDPTSYTSLSLSLRLGRPRKILEKLTTNYVSRFEKSSSQLTGGRTLEAFTVTPNGQVHSMIASPNGRSLQINHSTAYPEVTHVLHDAGRRRPWIPFISVADQFLLSVYGGNVVCIPFHEPRQIGPLHNFHMYGDLTITDAAAFPDNSSPQIALATSNGLYVGQMSSHDHPTLCPTLLKEQMVATFQDPNIVMSGERSGAVNFTDIRAPSTIHRLQHSSAVNGIVTGRSANHIIVSGLGTVAIYDLRYSTPASKKRKRATTLSSAPLVPFHVPITHRSDHYTGGKNLLYSPNLDITIVACQASLQKNGRVLLYNASIGQILDSPISKDTFHNMKGIALARVRDGPESIFVGEASGLHEYTVDKSHSDGQDTSEKTKKKGGRKGRVEKLPNLQTDRFPCDAKSGMAKLWRRGDTGPL